MKESERRASSAGDVWKGCCRIKEFRRKRKMSPSRFLANPKLHGKVTDPKKKLIFRSYF